MTDGFDESKSSQEVVRDRNLKSHDLGFLDFLFTFALATGLLEGTLNREGGYLSSWPDIESWPSLAETGELLTLLYAILTLSFSWYGYHDSIGRKPHLAEKWQGFVRFQIDVLLVLLYCVLLLSVESIEVVLGISTVIYSLYAVWDLLQNSEHSEHSKCTKTPNKKSWQKTLIWPLVFFICFVAAVYTPIATAVLAVIALVISSYYRYIKIPGVENGELVTNRGSASSPVP